MTGRALLVVASALAGVGCGEIERLELAVRPDPGDFAEAVQPVLVSAGCGKSPRCHGETGGELLIKAETDADSLQTSFQSVVGFVDLDAPDESALLEYVRTQEPPTGHRPRNCWTPETCAWRKIAAWIAWSGPGDERPQDIDCEVAEDELPCGP